MIVIDELTIFKKLTKLATEECFVIREFQLKNIVADLDNPNIVFQSIEDGRLVKYYSCINGIEYDRKILQDCDLDFGKKVITLVEKNTTFIKD